MIQMFPERSIRVFFRVHSCMDLGRVLGQVLVVVVLWVVLREVVC